MKWRLWFRHRECQDLITFLYKWVQGPTIKPRERTVVCLKWRLVDVRWSLLTQTLSLLHTQHTLSWRHQHSNADSTWNRRRKTVNAVQTRVPQLMKPRSQRLRWRMLQDGKRKPTTDLRVEVVVVVVTENDRIDASNGGSHAVVRVIPNAMKKIGNDVAAELKQSAGWLRVCAYVSLART
jgi:hypothetical protein